MIKQDAINQLTQLRDTMQERLDAEVAHIRNMPAREFAERGGYSMDSAYSIKSRFEGYPRKHTKPHYPGHPFYGYSLAVRSVTHGEVMAILKQFVYPFTLASVLDVSYCTPKYYTPQELNEVIALVENSEYEGIGEVKYSGREFAEGLETYTIKTGLQCSWIIQKAKHHVIIKNDGGENHELKNTPKTRVFRPSSLPYLLAEHHVIGLGYNFSKEGKHLIFRGKR